MNQLAVPNFVGGLVGNPDVRAEMCEYLAGLVADAQCTVEQRTVDDDTEYVVVEGPQMPDEVVELTKHDAIPLVLTCVVENVATDRAVHYLEVVA